MERSLPRTRRRAAGAAAIGVALAAVGCLQLTVSTPETLTYRERLDALYPPGQLHTAAPGYDAGRLDTIRLPAGASAEPVPGPADRRFLRTALRELRRAELGPVAGFDRYERVERPEAGSGAHAAEPRRVCDLVFFGPDGKILRAYRRFAPCRLESAAASSPPSR